MRQGGKLGDAVEFNGYYSMDSASFFQMNPLFLCMVQMPTFTVALDAGSKQSISIVALLVLCVGELSTVVCRQLMAGRIAVDSVGAIELTLSLLWNP